MFVWCWTESSPSSRSESSDSNISHLKEKQNNHHIFLETIQDLKKTTALHRIVLLGTPAKTQYLSLLEVESCQPDVIQLT